MKLPKKIRNIAIALGLGLALYTINVSAIPIAVKHSNFFKEIDNPKVQVEMGIRTWNNKFTYDYSEQGENAALKYLKLAHAITARKITSDRSKFCLTEDSGLHKGFCYERSVFTYSNFLFLIDTANKNNLRDFVRIATGHTVYKNISMGHTWLEVKLNGKWTPYETTVTEVEPLQVIDPESIDDLIPDSETIKFGAAYTRTNIFQINEKREKNSKLDLVGILKDYRGALGKAVYK